MKGCLQSLYPAGIGIPWRLTVSLDPFDSLVPKGFCIAGGSLGDIDDDGLEDALITLTSSGRRVAAYGNDVMPLLILLGQEDGSYALAARNTKALFSPYRSSSAATAGQGYIDIEYYYTGGAGHHNNAVMRFPYDEESKDWFLSEFYYVRMDNDFEKKLEPVAALPDFSGISITEFAGNEFYQTPDFEKFDKVASIQMPKKSNEELYDTFTIAVNFNQPMNAYEGYIYKRWASDDSDIFRGTIRGDYPSSEPLDIVIGGDNYMFQINNDTYIYDELFEAFFIQVD